MMMTNSFNVAQYTREKNRVLKIVAGSIFVVVIGFIVTGGEESAEEKQAIAYLAARETIVAFARETCSKRTKDQLRLDIGLSDTVADRPMGTEATLTRKGNGKGFNSIVCNYHKDHGVTSLTVDGVEKFRPEMR
jgi:hypothetical protein